ncbi:hypothetical protein ONZ51_g3725 [Trametes cubensis]|uniref:Uncharacterized protein n=1 Tax=Trametes cubensis TaxID=1111947 RepID=A0AAD7XAW8_9APHY|nr:hypothetical protein ONZ51_g3725 [Trametes cubensis]
MVARLRHGTAVTLQICSSSAVEAAPSIHMSSPPQPLTFVPYAPSARLVVEATHLGRRDQLKHELRTAFNSTLEELTGIPGVHLWYSPGRYAKLVVLKLKLKLVGWPVHVPYEDISKIKGGNEVLETLLNLWKSRALRFEPATERDLWYAKVDPARVHPNPSALREARGERRGGGASGGADGDDSGCEGDVEANGIGWDSELDIDVDVECAPSLPVRSGQCSVSDARLAAAETQALIVRSLVLHPATMEPLGYHYSSTRPSVAATLLGDRLRQQRSDIKKPRYRTAEDAQTRGFRRPREGVKSARYTLESSGGPLEFRGDFETEGDEGEPTRAAKRRRVDLEYWLTDDPVLEFSSSAENAGRLLTLSLPRPSSSSSAMASVEPESEIETAWGSSSSEAFGTSLSSAPGRVEVISEREHARHDDEAIETTSEGTPAEHESDIEDADSFST